MSVYKTKKKYAEDADIDLATVYRQIKSYKLNSEKAQVYVKDDNDIFHAVDGGEIEVIVL